MAGKLKIWGGTSFFEGRQVRFLAAAKTKKRIVEMVDIHLGRFSMWTMNMYWSETGNATELEVVRDAVDGGAAEGVWMRDDKPKSRYRRLV